MDVFAHGLWGGAAFYPKGVKRFSAAFFVGMAPDLLSFGVYHVTRPDWLWSRLTGEISGPPPLSTLPEFLFHAYNLTHSLVIWAALLVVIWMMRKRPPWLFLPWGLHILCDIPTHNSRYFPTPYLWPFSTPLVEGISWASPWFMVSNYTALLSVYCGMFVYMRQKDNVRKSSDR